MHRRVVTGVLRECGVIDWHCDCAESALDWNRVTWMCCCVSFCIHSADQPAQFGVCMCVRISHSVKVFKSSLSILA